MTDTDQLTIGSYLREARQQAGLSQRALAAQTGINQGNYAIAESQCTVYPALLDQLIPALDLDRDLAYHLAGRIPNEIIEGLLHDLPMVRELRRRLVL